WRAPLQTNNNCIASNILYVNNEANGNNSGNSWSNGMTDLRTAFNTANLCPTITEIRVAGGQTFFASEEGRSNQFISLPKEVNIKGGYDIVSGIQDVYNNKSRLTGSIGSSTDQDNSNVLLDGSNVGNGSYIEGFTFRNGYNIWYNNAPINFNSKDTTGLDFEFRNCSFTSNQGRFGGAIRIHEKDGNEMNIRFLACDFQNNRSNRNGGVVFVKNDSTANIQVAFENCLFTGNKATENGGIIASERRYDGQINVEFINSTLSQNSSEKEGEISTQLNTFPGSSNNKIEFKNSIIWNLGNTADSLFHRSSAFTGLSNSLIKSTNGAIVIGGGSTSFNDTIMSLTNPFVNLIKEL
ncbi:MAG: hypothetical protein AAGK97_14860, partial [Bacteroidota bacterium]